MILPDWFYAGVLDPALILTIGRAYFDLTGGLERYLFGVPDLSGDAVHCETLELAHHADHVVIDWAPRVAGLMRSASLAADLLPTPVQPSRFDGLAFAGMLTVLAEARICRPQLVARLVLNCGHERIIITRETAAMLADHDPPLPRARVGERVIRPDSAQHRRLATELDQGSARWRDIALIAADIKDVTS
jgi:chromosome partitioning protein